MDSKFIRLDKKTTQELMKGTVPITMFDQKWKQGLGFFTVRNLLADPLFQLLGWHHTWGLNSGSMRKETKKITEFFGKPSCYFQSWCLNSVWGLEWKGRRLVIYCSSRGLGIELQKDFPLDLLEDLYKDLVSVFINPDFVEDEQ